MKPVDFSFKIFNTDGTKNGEVTRMALLKIKINRYKKQINVAVTDLNRMDMFLGHNQLVKHNPEVNWKEEKIQFTRCPKPYRIKHQDIGFKAWRIQTMKSQEKFQQKIRKEPDPTNLEDFPKYI